MQDDPRRPALGLVLLSHGSGLPHRRSIICPAKLSLLKTPFFVHIAKFGSWVGEIVSEEADHAPGTWNQCNSIHCRLSVHLGEKVKEFLILHSMQQNETILPF